MNGKGTRTGTSDKKRWEHKAKLQHLHAGLPCTKKSSDREIFRGIKEAHMAKFKAACYEMHTVSFTFYNE